MNHIDWRYYPNPWRKGCGKWWLHWFNAQALWFDFRDAIQRMRRGWGNGDIFDLMTYHAGVTIGLLEHFKAHHNSYAGDSPDDYEAKLDLALDGWKAKYALLTEEGWEQQRQPYEEWAAPLRARWERGYAAFIEVYDSLWN